MSERFVLHARALFFRFNKESVRYQNQHNEWEQVDSFNFVFFRLPVSWTKWFGLEDMYYEGLSCKSFHFLKFEIGYGTDWEIVDQVKE